MQERVAELEVVLAEVLTALPSLTSSTTHQSVLYHETYIRVWNMVEGGAQLERLWRLCDWTRNDVKRGPGPGRGWMCVHGFYISTLTPLSLTNLEGYHRDYLARHQEGIGKMDKEGS